SLFSLLLLPPPRSTLFPYTTLFRSTPRFHLALEGHQLDHDRHGLLDRVDAVVVRPRMARLADDRDRHVDRTVGAEAEHRLLRPLDRKSTRLNSSHVAISYAVFCLKK